MVFLSPQYPVRPSSMTYDDVNHLSAKIKPKQQRVNVFLLVSYSPPAQKSDFKYVLLSVK